MFLIVVTQKFDVLFGVDLTFTSSMLFDQLTHPAFCHCFFLCFTVTLFLFFSSLSFLLYLLFSPVSLYILAPAAAGPLVTMLVDPSVCQSIVCTSLHIFVQTKISTTVGRVDN